MPSCHHRRSATRSAKLSLLANPPISISSPAHFDLISWMSFRQTSRSLQSHLMKVHLDILAARWTAIHEKFCDELPARLITSHECHCDRLPPHSTRAYKCNAPEILTRTALSLELSWLKVLWRIISFWCVIYCGFREVLVIDTCLLQMHRDDLQSLRRDAALFSSGSPAPCTKRMWIVMKEKIKKRSSREYRNTDSRCTDNFSQKSDFRVCSILTIFSAFNIFKKQTS